MHACGVIVEYNPFHNGHLYHLVQARKKSQANIMVAIMSGNFLQRGEPAIIDKFHRAKAALKAGADIVLELPYVYAVQSSHYFAMGAVRTLHEFGVDSLCFGSEQGNIAAFKDFNHESKKSRQYEQRLKKFLAKGHSYPSAHAQTHKQIFGELTTIDLTKPNNILGYSYVNRVIKDHLTIRLLTIKRIESDYHDDKINGTIASATSIRKQLLKANKITKEIKQSLPPPTIQALINYREKASMWHHWEHYFSFLKYRILTMSAEQLAKIHLVDEGLEHRILQTVKRASSFKHWMTLMKTKRYTWVRLQRMFVHILTHTTKADIENIFNESSVPYIRLLGFTKRGQTYLNNVKKQLNVPLIAQVNQIEHHALQLEERASSVYYSALSPVQQIAFQRRELQGPLIIKEEN